MGLLQSYAGKSTWEPEAKRCAEQAVATIQNSVKDSGPAPENPWALTRQVLRHGQAEKSEGPIVVTPFGSTSVARK
ncbi:MAG TPA: hypothetical protein VNW97_16195 [Candidatus Saccharimonadales bacterium]|jgi:hypothetical protein|nr:hypothetical protein [Candidatus Saccharimonadales bacterium]